MDNWRNSTSNDDTNSDGGRSFGKGRGFVPYKVDDSYVGGFSSDSGERRGRGGYRGGGRGGSSDFGDHRGCGGRYGGRHGGRSDGDGWSSSSSWTANDGGDNRRAGSSGRDHGGGRYDRDRDGGGSGGGLRSSRNRGNGDDDRPGGRNGSWDSEGRGGRDDGGNRGGRWNSGRRRDEDDGGGFGFGGGRERRESDEGVLTKDELFWARGIERGINFDDYENIEMKISGENPSKPVSSFADAQLHELIMTNLRKIKYDKPTPIQKYAIPAVMDGRDLMATAQTGSGKTAAFLLPIIHRIMSGKCEAVEGSCCSPQALILSPTRELAIQIKDNAKLYSGQSTVKVEILCGGVAMEYQRTRIVMGCNIMIATLGRLLDFVNRGWVKFDAIQFVVLDEADSLLDVGLKDEVNEVMQHETMTSQENRQTLMFSASFSAEIQKMAAQYVRPNYLFVTVGVVVGGGACKDVTQNFVAVERTDKKTALLQLLEEGNSPAGTLIFVEMNRRTDFLACFLSEKNIKTTSISGARYAHQRAKALRDFKSGRVHVLVATNMAVRCSDVVGVRHVVNFDLPKKIDEYVHRIGRTRRSGNKGRATSLYDSSNNNGLANNMVKLLKQVGQNVPDFIQSDSTGGGDEEESIFGGTDYRRISFGTVRYHPENNRE